MSVCTGAGCRTGLPLIAALIEPPVVRGTGFKMINTQIIFLKCCPQSIYFCYFFPPAKHGFTNLSQILVYTHSPLFGLFRFNFSSSVQSVDYLMVQTSLGIR